MPKEIMTRSRTRLRAIAPYPPTIQRIEESNDGSSDLTSLDESDSECAKSSEEEKSNDEIPDFDSLSQGGSEAKPYIPRPPNKFILFRAEMCRRVLPDSKGDKGNNRSEKSRIIAELWRKLPEKEHKLWEARAEKEKEEHKKMYPDYVYKPIRNASKGISQKSRKNGANGQAKGEKEITLRPTSVPPMSPPATATGPTTDTTHFQPSSDTVQANWFSHSTFPAHAESQVQAPAESHVHAPLYLPPQVHASQPDTQATPLDAFDMDLIRSDIALFSFMSETNNAANNLSQWNGLQPWSSLDLLQLPDDSMINYRQNNFSFQGLY